MPLTHSAVLQDVVQRIGSKGAMGDFAKALCAHLTPQLLTAQHLEQLLRIVQLEDAVPEEEFLKAALRLLADSAQAAPRMKVVKLAVTNPAATARPAEDIVVSVAALKRIAPDFSAGSAIVTTSAAATLDQDALALETTELPSQADDLDGDGKYDEIAFQIDLAPHQTRIVTIAYGEMAAMLRLRSKYPQRTYAKFATRY